MKLTEFTVNNLTRCKECGGEDLSLTATRYDLGRCKVWHLGTVTCLGCGRKVGGLGACEEQAKRAALIAWERKNKDDSQEKEPDMKTNDNHKFMFKGIPLKPELGPEVYSVPLPELAGYDGAYVYGWYVDGFIVGKVMEAGDEYIAIEYWVPVDPETVCLVVEARHD